MSAVKAMALSQLEEDRPVEVSVEGTDVVLVLTEGTVHAVGAICSHAQVPMVDGDVEGCALECYMHGSMFDLRTGKPLNLPATEPIPVYPVTIDGDDVLVDAAHPIKES
ncbi:Rieske (2Fe-2S) protein [Acidipropionibacterium timonense]|uniref:Rieske (2Fe-2S) protein n=1 Tax=Acidipropionibacterium timonense TaxID=2161818 RepID=UPI001030FEF2|nr:non-heme iron oxygenase ferredoxin subunit [Acidipropionibacterium timonense]